MITNDARCTLEIKSSISMAEVILKNNKKKRRRKLFFFYLENLFN
jgi:hypothetical protein